MRHAVLTRRHTVCLMQDWLDAPMSGSDTEGPTSLSELPPGPRSRADASGGSLDDGGEWAGFGTGDFYDTTDGSSADDAAATANGNSAASPLPCSSLSDSSLSGSTLSGSWRGSVDPADEPAGAAVTASQELEARGALRSLLRRLTPQWLTPRQRGLALLWMLVGLVATNWCVADLHTAAWRPRCAEQMAAHSSLECGTSSQTHAEAACASACFQVRHDLCA